MSIEREPMTCDEVAAELGVSKERVSQIEHDALRKLARCPGALREFMGHDPLWARCDCGQLATLPTGDECPKCVRAREYRAYRARGRLR